MKIKISKVSNAFGWEVYRKVGKKWKYWLPEPEINCRGDEWYPYFTTAKMAEKAARKAKAALDADGDKILEI